MALPRMIGKPCCWYRTKDENADIRVMKKQLLGFRVSSSSAASEKTSVYHCFLNSAPLLSVIDPIHISPPG